MGKDETKGDNERSNIFKDNLFSAIGLLGLFLTLLTISWYLIDKISTQGERLAKLEERVAICVKCDGKYPREKDKGGYKWTEYESEERDGQGNIPFAVEIDVLEDRYRWQCGKASSEDIQKNRWILNGSERLEEIIKNYEPKKELANAKKIIVVGTASQEGDLPTQTDLADRRARTLKGIVEDNLKQGVVIPVVAMSFGQYIADGSKALCTDKTSEQRRILIVKVTKQPEGITDSELEERIKKRFVELASDGLFPVDITDYSNYKRKMFLPELPR